MSLVLRSVVVLGCVLALPRAQSAPVGPVPVEGAAVAVPSVPAAPGLAAATIQDPVPDGDAVADLRRAVERVRRASLTPAERAAAARELRRLAEQLGGQRRASKPAESPIDAPEEIRRARAEVDADREKLEERLMRVHGADDGDRAKLEERLMRVHGADDADSEKLAEHLMRLHGADDADREKMAEHMARLYSAGNDADRAKLHEHLARLHGAATEAHGEELHDHLLKLAELQRRNGDEAAAQHLHDLYREHAERAAVDARDHAAAERMTVERAHGDLFAAARAAEPFAVAGEHDHALRAAVEAERAVAGTRARRPSAPAVPAVPMAPPDPFGAAAGQPPDAAQPALPPASGVRRRARAPGGDGQVDELRRMVEEMRAEMAAVRELLDAIRAERGRGSAR